MDPAPAGRVGVAVLRITVEQASEGPPLLRVVTVDDVTGDGRPHEERAEFAAAGPALEHLSSWLDRWLEDAVTQR